MLAGSNSSFQAGGKMDIRVGEKVTGVVNEVRDDGYVISLCNGVTGFAPEDALFEGVKKSNIEEGSEVKVRVDKRTEDGLFQVTLIKLFSRDNFQEKPDKYLKNVSHEKQNRGTESEEPEISEKLEGWFSDVDRTLEGIKENRKERLNVDFWTV